MDRAAALDEIADHDAPADGGGDGPRELQLLDELADYGRDIARAIAQRVQASEPDQPVAELQAAAMAYARVARAVRLTVMLKAKLAGAPAGDLAGTDGAEADEGGQGGGDAEEVRKLRVERIIERVAKARHPDDEDAVDRLVSEAGERLDDDDLYGGVLERPMSELLALICRDLGLELDWTGLAGEAWARQEIAEGRPGWPLAGCSARSDGGGVPPPPIERAVRPDTG